MKMVYVTFPDESTCKEIAEKVLEERLSAGVNLDSVDSIYWWDGELQEDSEYRAVFKTSEESVEELKSRILELHPYDTPCVAVFDADANNGFEEGIKKETG